MIVVSDTSPLRHLILIGQIDIIPKLFHQIVIPSQVHHELAHPHAPEPVRHFSFDLPLWVKVQKLRRMKPLTPLGIGEEAAINLAMELQADLLIIDDKCGRNVAVNSPYNLEVTGTVGLLELAANENLINFELALNQLVDSHF